MRKLNAGLFALLATSLTFGAHPAQAAVTVSFANQGDYTDVNLNGDFSTPGSRTLLYGGLRSIF